jgi:predicted secreted acid phosphatase
MKQIIQFLFLCVFAFNSATFALQPKNLNLSKQDVVRYYESHQYDKDVNHTIATAMGYLKARLHHSRFHGKKPAIVLDIDETSLSNYQNMVKMNFGGTYEAIKFAETASDLPAIEPTLKLFRYAKAHNVAVLFITGRDESERERTVENLEHAGYKDWDDLYFRQDEDKKKTAAVYKTALRKKLSADYDIILNVGDQKSDLVGHYADKVFLLPNPFYYIP